MQVYCTPLHMHELVAAGQYVNIAKRDRKGKGYARTPKTSQPKRVTRIFTVFAAFGAVSLFGGILAMPKQVLHSDLVLFVLVACGFIFSLVMAVGSNLNNKALVHKAATQKPCWRFITPEGIYTNGEDKSFHSFFAWSEFEKLLVSASLYVLQLRNGTIIVLRRADMPDPAFLEAEAANRLGAGAIFRFE